MLTSRPWRIVGRILGALLSLWGAFLLLNPRSDLPEDRNLSRDRLTLIIGASLLAGGLYLILRRPRRA
jgi:hypothetical protein